MLSFISNRYFFCFNFWKTPAQQTLSNPFSATRENTLALSVAFHIFHYCFFKVNNRFKSWNRSLETKLVCVCTVQFGHQDPFEDLRKSIGNSDRSKIPNILKGLWGSYESINHHIHSHETSSFQGLISTWHDLIQLPQN